MTLSKINLLVWNLFIGSVGIFGYF